MKVWVSILLAISLFGPASAFAQGANTLPPDGQGNPTREFVMSCTYGVLAGTLVGAASLAFTDKPSDNLNKVARGASLGLYTGILLGLYVVYIVPGMDSAPEEEDPVARIDRIPLMVNPIFENGQLAGADFSWKVLRF